MKRKCKVETGWDGDVEECSVGGEQGMARGALLDWCRARLDNDRRPPAIIRAPRQSARKCALHAPY